MDDFDNDRDSNASSDEQQDDAMTMEDADEMEVEEDDQFNEEEEDNYDGEQEHDGDGDNDNDHEQEHEQDGAPEGEEDHTVRVDAPPSKSGSALQSPTTPKFRPQVRPEALSARLYDIVPTMAAPQATSINALAITPDLRYWMTGGSDGYVRKYDGPGTINGKQLLTVAQRHPFVDSVTKAGILMSYWENFEPPADKGRTGVSDEDKVLSPVYSLAVHSEALWSLAGLESGGINLHSVRYDEGKVIHTLPAHSADHEGHANAVSVLQLTPSETSVLSGSWDKRIFDWDLNTGNISAKFDGSGGQISAIELRPLNGAPIPAEAAEEPAWGTDTYRSSDKSRTNGFFANGLGTTAADDSGAAAGPGADGIGDGDTGSDHESLFGSPAGSLFGEGQMGDMGGSGGGAFGGDDDNEFSHAMLEPLEDAPAETTLGDTTMVDAAPPEIAAATATFTTSNPTDPAAPVKPEGGESSAFSFESNNTNANTSPSDAAQPDPSQQLQADADAAAAEAAAAATAASAQQPQIKPQSPQPHDNNHNPSSPSLVFNPPPPPQHDPSQTSDSIFLAASMNGTIRIWDRRLSTPVARISTRAGVPPWCMGACWSPDGNLIHVGRRNGTVEEFSIHHARGGYPGWQPERSLRFPAGSGAVSAVRPMPNGRHLVCASHDILRLYDLKEQAAFKHGAVPFLIIPGPPRAGVISQLYIDPTARFMVTAAGTRGWDGSSTEVLIGYEIASLND